MKPKIVSFGGGEIVEEMHDRLNLTRRQTGITATENVRVLPAGPVEKRQGTVFITPPVAVSGSALVPLVFGDAVSFAVELSASYIAFYALGAAVLNSTALSFTSVTQGATTSASLGSPTINETLVYFDVASNPTHPLHGRYWRYNHSAGTLKTPHGDPVDSSGWPALSWNGGTDSVYQRLVLSTASLPGDLRQTRVAVRDNLMTLTNPAWTVVRRIKYDGGSTPFSTYAVSFQPNIAGVSTSPVASGSGGTPVTVRYRLHPLTADGLHESFGTQGSVNVDLTVDTVSIAAPSTVSVYDDNGDNAAAVSYVANVYKSRGGVFGFIGQVASSETFVDDNITPDMTRTKPATPQAFGGLSSASIGAVACAYWNQRLWLGAVSYSGTTYPQTLAATRPGTDRNIFVRAIPQDDDAILMTLATKISTSIRHLVSLDELLALTANSIVRVGNGQEPATPAIGSRTIANVGASHVPPVEAASSVLFIGAADQHVWELRYTNEGGGYRAQDISLFATHLFDGYEIVQLAFAKGRVPTLYALRNDGVLLAATYVPEQEVVAWYRVISSGEVQSLCVIPELGVDAVYLIVHRTLNGETRSCVEQLQTNVWTEQANAYFVDCGLSYSGEEVSTVTGLWHLEGEDVKVVADGAAYDAVVEGGEVELDTPASTVHVGLYYRSRFKTLPIILEGLPAAGTANMQNGSHVWLSLYRSLAVRYGVDFDNLHEIPTRLYESMGTAPALVTETTEVVLSAEWDLETAVCFESTDPVPFTIRSMAVNVVEESGAQER